MATTISTTSADLFAHECVGRVRRELEETGSKIISGGCSDYAQYQNMVGRCRGMQTAIDIVRQVQKERNEPDLDNSDLPEMT